MRNWYNFLFYCFFILDRLTKPKWWSEQKAAFYICVVDFWIILTFYGFFSLILDRQLLDKNSEFIAAYLCMGTLVVYNWNYFLRNNKFKKIVAKYDRKSKNGGNKSYYYFVLAALVFIISLMSTMFYLTGLSSGEIK